MLLAEIGSGTQWGALMSSHAWFLSQIKEQTTLFGLTSLRTNVPSLLPKLNRKRPCSC